MKFIDLFAGIGGIRLDFEEHGKCVFSSEWDANSQKTHIANFSVFNAEGAHSHVVYGVVSRIQQ